MKTRAGRPLVSLTLAMTACVTLPWTTIAVAQDTSSKVLRSPPIRTVAFRVGGFMLALRQDTQTLARLSPISDPAFDFVPGPREAERQADGYVHVGDLNLRLRTLGGAWQDFASAHQRKPILALKGGGRVFAAADITASMGAGIPLTVERRWIDDGGAPALRFTLINHTKASVEIGALGMPMVFDNIITDRTLEQAHSQASFTDPYIGRDAGYLQVTRLNGKGPALLVLPGKSTPLEAYRPIDVAGHGAAANLFTDRSPRSQTSEGFYDWTVVSKGFAEKEWKNAGEQWNTPTSFTLAPGERRTVELRFVQSPTIETIEDTLAAQRRPVAVGIPGYVVPMDLDASLFLKSPRAVTSMSSYPDGALTATPDGTVNGWARYTIRGNRWGRARLTIGYGDGSTQTVSYFVTKPLEQTMSDLGHFTTTKQWYDNKGDPFHRTPAILTYDRDADRIVTQEPRVWISGMSDEGGAGSWVAAMSKQLDTPDPVEVAKLERLVDDTVQGHLQVKGGDHAGAVRKSIFYYDPAEHPGYYDPTANWKSWTSWSKKDAGDVGRAYNYPHVAIGYWVLYRLARNHPGLVTAHAWQWYLDHAYETVAAMMRDAPYYTQFGLMEGDVFVDILKDLKREGRSDQASSMEAMMKRRADHWKTLAYPFGSEMAWDSTGQPEVYAWMRYFGYDKQADQTRDAILAYDPTIPSWGYNGDARRYWDFLYGGKVARIERQIHHYGSTLNAVPLFDAYRHNPSDLHLLRVAYGGLMGGITNIDQDGFGAAAFHAWPDMMKWDSYTGDYGMGFFGHAYAAATYVVKDPTLGWLAFGGNLTQSGGIERIVPRDGARSRLFVAPAGVWITLEAGKITSATYAPATGRIVLTLDPADAFTPSARVFIDTPTAGAKAYRVPASELDRGGYSVPLSGLPTIVALTTQ